MSCTHPIRFHGRGTFAVLLVVIAFSLSGCYVRQIEGLQADLDSLDRKVHTISQKPGSAARPAEPPSSAVLQLEDRVNQMSLQQNELLEEVRSLRLGYADIKTGAAPAAAGAPLSDARVSSLEKRIAESDRKASQSQRDVNDLKRTFESIQAETKTLIQVLKEEFGGMEDDTSVSPASSPLSSSTKIESPSAPMTAEIDPSLVPESPGWQTAESEPTQVAQAGGGKTYHVQPRDTLADIAKKFGVTTEELQSANQIENPRRLRLGQVVHIP